MVKKFVAMLMMDFLALSEIPAVIHRPRSDGHVLRLPRVPLYNFELWLALASQAERIRHLVIQYDQESTMLTFSKLPPMTTRRP